MATIITAAQLRAVLGVNVSVYSDAQLNEIIETAEQTCLPMLTAHTIAVEKYELKDNVATFFTVRPHFFSVGQSVITTGLPSPFNATNTLTHAGEYWFKAAITNADIALRWSIPNGVATLSGKSAFDIYTGNSTVETAIYALSTDILQSRKAAGGQIESIDGTISPYRMGVGIFNRVKGILGSYLDTDAMVD